MKMADLFPCFGFGDIPLEPHHKVMEQVRRECRLIEKRRKNKQEEHMGLFGSITDVLENVVDIATAPAEVVAEVAKAVTKPVADAAKEVVDEVKDALDQ